MITAYGAKAIGIRTALPDDVGNAVIFDETGLTAALADAQGRRARGEFFHAFAIFDHGAVKAHTAFAAELNATTINRERRYFTASMYARGVTLEGAAVPDLWSQDYDALIVASQEVLALADVMLVRSNFEYAELCKRSPFYYSRRFRRVLLSHTVPSFERKRPAAPSLVVWTGRRPVSDATLALIGLEEFCGDVAYVGDAPIPHIGARYIGRDDPELGGALAVAGCVVCADPADPADAVAFARLGIPVVAPVSCAAYEFANGIVSWQMADASNLSLRVNYALGTVAAEGGVEVVAARPIVPPLRPGTELPLVTVLTATYNRRASLRRMLSCLAAQTYPNIESIVVNDAGEAVDDVVAEFPFARLIEAGVNQGTFFRASRLGLSNVRGEYVAMLPDDDWFYPDHIELLMNAIVRTGARVAHSFGLLRFSRTAEDGSEQTYGFNPLPYSATVNRTASLIGTPVAMSQCLLHRDVFAEEDVGWPRLEVQAEAGSDQEYFMRIMQRHQLVAVDRYTCEFRDHAGNAGKVYNWADGMDYVYRELQPLSGHPIAEAIRARQLETMRAVPAGENVNQPAIRF